MTATQKVQRPLELVHIRDYRPGDEDRLAELAVTCFSDVGLGGTGAWLREWRWKFTGGYTGEYAPSVAQLKDGRIIGHYGSMIRLFKVGRDYHKVGVPIDNMIAPECRGGNIQRKLFAQQRRFAARIDVPFGLGIPNPSAYVVGRRLLRYKNLTWIKCFHADLTMVRRLWRKWQWRHVPACADLAVHLVERVDDRFDELWERLRKSYPCTEVRSSAFLRWRHEEAPDRDYEILAAHGANGIEGYVVLRYPLESDKSAEIVDLFAPPERPILSTLLRAALGHAAPRARGLDFRVAASEIFYRSLVENRIHWTGYELPVVYWRFSDKVNVRHFENPQRWYITGSLADLV